MKLLQKVTLMENFHLGHVKADFLFSTKYENPRCVMPLFHLNVLNVHGI